MDTGAMSNAVWTAFRYWPSTDTWETKPPGLLLVAWGHMSTRMDSMNPKIGSLLKSNIELMLVLKGTHSYISQSSSFVREMKLECREDS